MQDIALLVHCKLSNDNVIVSQEEHFTWVGTQVYTLEVLQRTCAVCP